MVINNSMTFDMADMNVVNNNGPVLTLQGQFINLYNGSLKSMGGGYTVNQSGLFADSTWDKLNLFQESPNYGVWTAGGSATLPGWEYSDIHMSGFYFGGMGNTTVCQFNLMGMNGINNDNIWENGICSLGQGGNGVHGSNAQFFNVGTNNLNGSQYGNTWRKITWEQCYGGGILMNGVRGFVIDDCQSWDTQFPVSAGVFIVGVPYVILTIGTTNFMAIGAASNTIGVQFTATGVGSGTGTATPLVNNHFYSCQPGVGTATGLMSSGRISNCGKWGSWNAASVFDVSMNASGGSSGWLVLERCDSSNTTATTCFSVDFQGNNGVVIGAIGGYLQTLNASKVLILPITGNPGLTWGNGSNIYSTAPNLILTDGAVTAGQSYGSFTHSLNNNSSTLPAVQINANNALPGVGLKIAYNGGAPNGTSNEFLQCFDTGAVRTKILSNGGLANFSANNTNLCDIRTKKDIRPAKSHWNVVKKWEVVTFLYRKGGNRRVLGAIAQQIEKVSPEFVDSESGFAKDGSKQLKGGPLKMLYQTDMQFAMLKALQEAMARIEALEAKAQ
jgi:hypothetical protein